MYKNLAFLIKNARNGTLLFVFGARGATLGTRVVKTQIFIYFCNKIFVIWKKQKGKT